MKYLIMLMCLLGVFNASAQEAVTEKQPEPISSVKPAYPLNAFKQRMQGHVLVSYDINNDGHVINARVVSAEPAGIFDAEALSAIQKWEFSHNQPYQGATKLFTFKMNH